MPVYNLEKYIGDAIKSVLNQTMKDFELIIINDASKDDTEKIIRKFVKIDKRIKLINHKKNKLRAGALNTGLNHAKGEYITFLDGDDLYTSNKLELQSSYLDQHPEVDMLYTNMLRFYPDGKIKLIQAIKFEKDPKDILIKASKRKDLGEIRAHRLINLKKRKRIIPGASAMIRKEVFKDLRFDESLPTAQDYDMWFKIIGKGYKLAKLPRITYKYRMHKGQTTKKMDKRIQSYLLINDKLKKGVYFK